MRIIIFCIILMLCVSCNSLPFKQIKLEGGYGDYTGGIVFELDGEKTGEEKAPVFEENKDGEKRLLFTFGEDQIKKLKDLIKEKIGIKKVVTANEAVSDYRYIVERLK